MQCWTADSQEMYRLVDACGSGGEGTTYQVEGHPGLIAKIYNQENLERHFPGASGENEWTMREKIFHMISAYPSLNLTVPQFGAFIDAVAWPTKALFDSRSYFIGFLMPKVEFAVSDDLGITDLHCAYRQWERQHLFGDSYSWLTAIRIAANLAAVVQRLHENDIVIGDFNCNNILIDGQGHVTLIDADSLCIHNRQRGITYRCIVGVGEFLAPELQGVPLDDTRSRRSFTKESDCFSLAIHIFMLLMNGTHPFSGEKTGDERRASSSMEPYARAIAYGECPYVTGSKLAPFAGTPKMRYLPYYIQEMFDRAFGYASPDRRISQKAIASRPTAKEWRDVLRQLYGECASSSVVCPRDKSHVNLVKNNTCMWCEAEGVSTPLDSTHGRKETQEKTPPNPTPEPKSKTDTNTTKKRSQSKYKKLAIVFGSAVCVSIVCNMIEKPSPKDSAQNSAYSSVSTSSDMAEDLYTQEQAEQGDATAQFLLGNYYYFGIGGMEQDYQEAAKWYRAAAEQGYDSAQNRLGNCYFRGEGVEQDDAQAIAWWQKAAAQGNEDAQTKLDEINGA